jgi:hypothetical protein
MRSLGLLAIAACTSHPTVRTFTKRTLDTAFRAEGVAVFDVDRDGHADIVTDQYWYAGPGMTPHEIRTPEAFDVAVYSHDVGAWGDDIDGDGWTDLVVAPFPTDAAYWYENPHGLDQHWTVHEIAPALSAAKESPIYVDLFGDGHRVLIMGDEPALVLAWFAPGPDPRAPWIEHPISAPGFAGAYRFAHGLGIGDVNGDGRSDVLTSQGWFEQTADRAAWPFHAFSFGPDECSTMYALDLDRDGLADVLCAHPHVYGLRWWQQLPGGGFTEHSIDETISQMHAVGLADLDGDGVPEIVTGKTRYAHTYDPGAEEPSLLVYYTIAPGPVFVRHQVDDASGIGRTVTIADVDGDRRPDIVVSNKNGLFYFRRR